MTEIEMHRTGLIDPETPVGLTESDFDELSQSLLQLSARECATLCYQSNRDLTGAIRHPFSVCNSDGVPVDDVPPIEVMVIIVSGNDELKNRLTEVLQAATGQEMKPYNG